MTANLLLFANNAKGTLAAPLTNTGLTATLGAGQGALFPNPIAGETFLVTFVDAATGLLNEIALCTARSGDSLTITRAQEGTTALNWLAGDLVQNFGTAGAAAKYIQGNLPVTAIAGLTNAAHTLTLPEYLAQMVTLAGTLTGALPINFPDGVTGWWIVQNNTTGAYAITLKTTSGTGVVAPQDGNPYVYYSDGVNMHALGYTTSATLPDTPQIFTSGGTYTVPAGARTLHVRVIGAGGGGGGLTGNGSNGSGTTTFGTSLFTAAPGSGGVTGNPGAGGAGGAPTIGSFTGTSLAFTGQTGENGKYGSGSTPINTGGNGASTPLGQGGVGENSNPASAPVGYGAGGGGAAISSGSFADAGGGGAGAYIEGWITGSLASTYAVTIATGGGAGAGAGGTAGANGVVIVEAF